MAPPRSRPAGRPGGAVLLLALLAAAGCGRDRRVAVTGTAEFDGKPIPAGAVYFFGSNNRTAAGTIVDGKFRVADAPAGEVTVTVDVPRGGSSPKMMGKGADKIAMPKGLGMPAEHMPEQDKAGGAPDKAGGFPPPPGPAGIPFGPIPARYKDVESSPLKFTLTDNGQTVELKLTP